jgi:HEAT repeat protein
VTWWASKQWQEAAELACDRAVVRTDHEVEDYAENLVAVLAKIRGQRRGILAGGLFATRTQIGRRIAALFSNPLRHPARLGAGGAIALAGVAVVCLSVGSSLAADSVAHSAVKLPVAGTAPAEHKEPAEVRRTVDEAITMLSTTSEHQRDRVNTVLDMVRGVPQGTALDALSGWLQSDVATKRRSAVYILGALQWDDASVTFPALRGLLKHEEFATRGMAALSLVSIGDAGSYDAILEMAKNDKDAYARRCAAAALGELGDPKALDSLQGIKKDSDPSVSRNAENAIDRLTFLRDHAGATDDAKRVVRAVWMVAGSTAGDETKLGRAAELARSATPEARAAVLDDASKSHSTAIRNSAEYIKGRIETSSSTEKSSTGVDAQAPAVDKAPKDVQSAIDEAIDTLSTTSEFERDRVKSVFDIVRGQPQIPALEALAGWLKSTDANKRRSAVYIIGALPWDDVSPALPALRDLLKHDEVTTRGMAALSLATVGDTACYEAVLEMAQKDKDGYARRCAAWALGELGDPKALEPLKAIKADSDMGVSSNAENAIDRLTFLRDHATASKEAMPAVRGIWIVAGSTAWDETRLGRAFDLVQSAAPEVRASVLDEAAKSSSIAIRNSVELIRTRIEQPVSAPAVAAGGGAGQ